MAATPAAAGLAPAPPRRWASTTLTAPLAMSSTATSTPAVRPEARSTLAAPRLPLPICRRSAAPQRRARIRANGIDPMRYAAAMISGMSDARAPTQYRTNLQHHEPQHVERCLRRLVLHLLAVADELKGPDPRVVA